MPRLKQIFPASLLELRDNCLFSWQIVSSVYYWRNIGINGMCFIKLKLTILRYLYKYFDADQTASCTVFRNVYLRASIICFHMRSLCNCVTPTQFQQGNLAILKNISSLLSLLGINLAFQFQNIIQAFTSIFQLLVYSHNFDCFECISSTFQYIN